MNLDLTPLQQAVAITGAGLLIIVIFYLIYRRRLREDYAAIWLAIGMTGLVLAVWPGARWLLVRAFDAQSLTGPLLLLGILFMMLALIHFSVRVSALSRQVKGLAQEIALLNPRSSPSGGQGAGQARSGAESLPPTGRPGQH